MVNGEWNCEFIESFAIIQGYHAWQQSYNEQLCWVYWPHPEPGKAEVRTLIN